MNTSTPNFPPFVDIGNSWSYVETGYGFPGHTSVYICHDSNKVAVFDAAITTSVDKILAGIAETSHTPEDVEYLFLSHAHLDHTAGAGALIKHLPKAKILCHETTAKLMINPEKLIEGARNLYEDAFDRLYGEIEAIPEDRVKIVADGDIYKLGSIELEVLFTPGHNFDHICILDKARDTIFVGDTFGVWLPPEYGMKTIARVPAAPTQFAPEEWKASINKIVATGVSRVCPSHYSPMPGPVEVRAKELIADIDYFVQLAKETKDEENPVPVIREKVKQYWINLFGKEPPKGTIDIELLLCSRGIALWQKRHLDKDKS